ncbi:YqcI/YcgG family protein [Sutcliffiella rhizosphaerae]|uniref:Cupin domain-containing protein n=1 Tax=Sutcliffiella rhizosphaerae TaxID=2880967 RepID=A0ABM8YP57_9BACI|nr:YqcI/YcgG family protein [Sutcliffiella rhizosphaerae]CAG9621591.1 hypothetical protein BACCIP111883_02364 [Sutcliffiella rhizosphaerae]
MLPVDIASLYTFNNIQHWGHKVFDDFTKDMLSNTRPFPCVLGVEGFRQGALRFAFIESTSSNESIHKLGTELKNYLQTARSLGKNTSFVSFFKPEALKTLEEYEAQFWDVLNALHHLDEKKWPNHIPTDPDHYLWEFSFWDEPMFVVCNTPAHEKRVSRKASTFMITFQPRWVFEGINGNTVVGKQLQKKVRERMEGYDSIAPHPALNWYGNEDTREWRQYFLMDDNNMDAKMCPFQAALDNTSSSKSYHIDHRFSDFRVEKGVGRALEEVVNELLPIKGTGYVEVQKDEPFKAHPSHTHPCNEILHILKGSISLEVNSALYVCNAGDRIFLPKEMVHGSLAGIDGCLYVIAVLTE